jgi:type II secretory pathway component PulM
VREWWGRLRTVLEQLSPRERWLVGGVAGVFAVVLVLLGVVNPLRAALEGGRERAAAAEQQLSVALALRRELDEVRGRLAHVEQRIREGPRGNLFTTLESLARESAVKVDSMQPQTVPSDTAYRETKVEVKLEGVSLAQLANYLNKIESAPQLLSVKSLRIRTRSDKPDLLDVSFTVSSFEPV